MSFLRDLFRKPEPAPACEVDPADQDLVLDSDLEWWASLTLDDVRQLESEDSTFKIALFSKLVEKDGLTQDEAASRVARAFPIYYLTRANRSKGEDFSGEDAKLPYPIKQRVNDFNVSTLHYHPEVLKQFSSFNALVRAMARDGHL